MKLNHDLQLSYCTSIHPGETWVDTFRTLQTSTLSVRDQVSPGKPFGIGLRLSHQAARELSEPATLMEFRKWLDRQHCYVFTINGSPYGRFHGGRVKEQAYIPDWTQPERLEYTKLLFDLLAWLVPPGVEGTVTTLAGSLKSFVTTPEECQIFRSQIWRCVEHAARVSEQTERHLSLALEPEPLCLIENSRETILFFDRLRAEHGNDPRLRQHLGVTYDAAHFALEFEEPLAALGAMHQHGIKISKIQISNALKAQPTPDTMEVLAAFANDVYLHPVALRTRAAKLRFYKDLPHALAHECAEAAASPPTGEAPTDQLLEGHAPSAHSAGEWRVLFRVPLHQPLQPWCDTTEDHTLGVLDVLQLNPALCPQLEIETYTWEVLPQELKLPDPVDQIVAEYGWTLERLAERGLATLA